MQTYFDFSFRCYAVLIQEQLKELHNASNVRCQQFRIKLGGRQSVMLIQKSTTKKRQKSNKFSILTCSLVASISWVLRAVSSGATIWWTWIQQNDNNYTQMQRAIWKIVRHVLRCSRVVITLFLLCGCGVVALLLLCCCVVVVPLSLLLRRCRTFVAVVALSSCGCTVVTVLSLLLLCCLSVPLLSRCFCSVGLSRFGLFVFFFLILAQPFSVCFSFFRCQRIVASDVLSFYDVFQLKFSLIFRLRGKFSSLGLTAFVL